jgi:hypothetical protein
LDAELNPSLLVAFFKSLSDLLFTAYVAQAELSKNTFRLPKEPKEPKDPVTTLQQARKRADKSGTHFHSEAQPR